MAAHYEPKRVGDRTQWATYDDYREQKIGEFLFSFDGGKTVYNLFRDYPWKLSDHERDIFDEENPFWADFFLGRDQMEDPHPKGAK